MKMLAKIFTIVDQSNRGVLLTAVVELQELQNIRYSVRTMITSIFSQRLVGQRCNGSRNAVGKEGALISSSLPSMLHNDK